MKNLRYILYFIVFILPFVSCLNEKKDSEIACTAEYRFPTLNFQVINKDTHADLFFSPTSAYTRADIKVYLKNYGNKIDSLIPVVKTDTDKYFSFSLQQSSLKDTCYIKIKGLKPDTLVYTLSLDNAPCPQPYVNTVAINKATAIIITPTAILQVKK